jgi:PAS domain S-box-containing protein
MMRFGTPVANRAGSKTGVLILNYLGDTLLQTFRTATANIGDRVMLVNAEGYWLSSPNPDEQWGFMLEHGRSFARSHPDAWSRISASESGQFRAEHGLYTFTTLQPVLAGNSDGARSAPPPPRAGGQEHWKIVSRLSQEALAASPASFLYRYLWLYSALFALSAIAAFFFARATLRHQLAETQLAFEQRFREILENVSLLAVRLDREGRIDFCNDALLKLTGRTREELMGRVWFEAVLADEHRDPARNHFENIIAARDVPSRHEVAIQTAAGDRRLIAWNDARLQDAEGNVSGVTCIGDDITDARQIEQELRKVSRAVEQSPSTVMITDVRGNIEYVNPKFTQLTGYTLEEVRGRNPRMLKSGETAAEEYRRLWVAVTSGAEWRGVFHNRKKSGELYWEATCISPIRDPSGKITHLLAVKEDITERRRLEDEVEERKSEILRTQALAEVGRMANMVAHDIRNPLSSVKMTLQMLGRRPARRWGPEERELQQISLEQVRYMEEILSDLMSYSRPDSLAPEWISIDKVLDTAILLAQKHISEHRVQVHTRYWPGLPTVYADPAKLRQAFANLLVNAAQASEGVAGREPEIRLSTELELRAEGPCIRVEICDNGCGIEPGQEEKVFEPFYTTRAKGTGLGLAIVRRMVELHGGAVSLRKAARNRPCAMVILPTRARGERGAAGADDDSFRTEGTDAVAEKHH